MDFDKSSSSIVLNVAWSEVDKKNQGFIYAKNFPVLIKSIETILSKGAGKETPLPLLSNTGVDVIDTFAKEKEFFKIYKDEFKELFHGLIGKSFKDVVEGTQVSKSKIIRLLKDNGKEEESPMKGRLETPKRINHKLKNMETRILTINEELRFKDDIIAEKDRELIKLTRSLGDYKDKYQFLQRQFSFYKDHGETVQGDEDNSRFIDDEPKNSTKHEFIISELKRKLQEQTVIISALRDQMQTQGMEMGSIYKRNATRKLDMDKMLEQFTTMNFIWVFVLTAISLLSILLCVRSWLSPTEGPFPNQIELSWWENNNFLSRLGWLFQEWTEPLIETDFQNVHGESSVAYDKIFGLRNSEL